MTFYEIWDGGTGNRVGGTFASEAEAMTVLADVMRVNGEEAVSDMGVMACAPDAEGKIRRRMVLEGADFVERCASVSDRVVSGDTVRGRTSEAIEPVGGGAAGVVESELAGASDAASIFREHGARGVRGG